MGRKSVSGGVAPLGNRIQFDITYAGKRRRPTIDEPPTQANLKRARRRMQEIQQAIARGTFDFAAEFPDYRFLEAVAGPAADSRTVDQVCAAFVESLRARGELAYSTVETYRKILQRHIQRRHGKRAFDEVTFSELEAAVNAIEGKRKTFNNVVSAVREAWEYGYKELPGQANPAAGLKGVRIPKREQVRPDPFDLDEAEDVIAETRRLWGEEQANYEEARFFAGFRPSEQIAIEWSDVDLVAGTVAITKARVMARDKDETKNRTDRLVQLNPRALGAFQRQRAIWSRLKLEGKLEHNHVFFREDGNAFHDLQVQGKRWNRTLDSLKMAQRDPYNARHSSVSWHLTIGKNLLWVAEQHGHSPAVMLKTYAKWMGGADQDTVDALRDAMGFGSDLAVEKAEVPRIRNLGGGERGIRTHEGGAATQRLRVKRK